MIRVSALEREKLELESRIRSLHDQAGRARSDLRECLSGAGRDMAQRGVRLQANAAFSLHGQTHASAITLAGVLRRLEAARGELMAATTARKAVERLRERRFEEWSLAHRAAEARGADDLATIAFGRGDAQAFGVRSENGR